MQVQEKMKTSHLSNKSETEAAAALRAELEIELQNKKQCSYKPYECTQLTLDGYKYCLKHILQDKNSPFKQCSFVYSNNGKRCQLPAPRGDKKDFGFCNEHALKATLAKNKQNSKCAPPNTAEVLLQSLSHYVKKSRNRTVSSSSAYYSDDASQTVPDENSESRIRISDPFLDLDASSIYNRQCNDILDLCSESESDVETSTFATVWHDVQGDSSDNESIDSEQEDVLKHANVYTAEEITLVTKDKLVRLQSLYIEQYRHLQHMLKEKRRKYLHSSKREKETCCNIYSQVRDNPKEQRLYKKLKAYNNYHKTYGVDAILNKRLRDLRAKITDGVPPKGHNYSKCLFTEGGVKCGERTLPLARHCRRHILEDPNQVLFKPCGKINGDVECNTPVESIFDESSCRLHMEVPPLRSYSQPRKDSESDFEESGEASQFPLQFSENIKTELIDYNLPSEIPKMETLPSILFEENQNIAPNSPLESDSLFNTTMNVPEDISKFDAENVKMEVSESLIEHNLMDDIQQDCETGKVDRTSHIGMEIDNTNNNIGADLCNANKCDDTNQDTNDTSTLMEKTESNIQDVANENEENVASPSFENDIYNKLHDELTKT